MGYPTTSRKKTRDSRFLEAEPATGESAGPRGESSILILLLIIKIDMLQSREGRIPMYVCICNALTDGDVFSAEAEGAANEQEIFQHFGVRPQCGGCISSMRCMLGCTEVPGTCRRNLRREPSPEAAAPECRNGSRWR